MSILGIALPLLGVGGIGAALWFIPGAKEAVAGFVKSIPPKVWICLAVVAVLVGGYFLHQSRAHKALAAEYARGASDEDAKWDIRLKAEHAEAMRWKAQADAAAAKISTEERARNEAERDAIAARADDQRVHGPGRAAAPSCGQRSATGLPSASGGHDAASGAGGSTVAGLPDEEPMAIVPWSGLVSVGERADQWRSEAMIWREWYARQAKAWQDAKAKGAGDGKR